MYIGGKDIVFGNYGLVWKFYWKFFIIVLCQYFFDVILIERWVLIQVEKFVKFMDD